MTPGMTNSTLAISSPELGEGSLSSSFFGCFIKLFLSEGNEDFPNPLARGKTAESWGRRASRREGIRSKAEGGAGQGPKLCVSGWLCPGPDMTGEKPWPWLGITCVCTMAVLRLVLGSRV